MDVWRIACDQEDCFFIQDWSSPKAKTKGYCTILEQTDYFETGSGRHCSFKKTEDAFEKTEAAAARRRCRLRRDGILWQSFKTAN